MPMISHNSLRLRVLYDSVYVAQQGTHCTEGFRDEKDESAAQDLRLRVVVAAGDTARIEAGEGKALEFVCKGDAQAMTATAVDRVALNHAGE